MYKEEEDEEEEEDDDDDDGDQHWDLVNPNGLVGLVGLLPFMHHSNDLRAILEQVNIRYSRKKNHQQRQQSRESKKTKVVLSGPQMA